MNKLKVFAINVEKNKYRRERIISQSKILETEISIFKAITPEVIKDQPEKYNSKRARRFTGRDLLPTEIACGLSHLRLWKNLINDDNAEYYLIFEDDVSIHDNIIKIIKTIDLSKIDFLKFSGQHKRPAKLISDLACGYKLYKFAYGPLDAAAYLISKAGAEKMYNYCKEIHSPIDILMDRSYSHGIPVYGVMPYPASTKWCIDTDNPLFSDIGIRDYKYDINITIREKLFVKVQRIIGSIHRKKSAIQLHMKKEFI